MLEEGSLKDHFQSSDRFGEGAILWFSKILSGFLLIAVLVIHLVVNHLVVSGGLLSHQQIVSYYQMAFIPAMEIIFLIVVVTHALLGLRSVLLDLKPSNKLLRVVNISFVLIGLAAITYGIWLVVAILNQG
jgi:succinate dehydrogenase / fumarate reductase membrane anchor subunit